jgi:hypothetical protein
MNRRGFLQGASLLAAGSALNGGTTAVAEGQAQKSPASGLEQRRQWVSRLKKTAGPVLKALSERRLKQVFPVECKPGQEASRRQCTYLEALGRTICGIGPWLETGAESVGGEDYRALAQEALRAAVDPASPDLVPFGSVPQTLVDAAFLGLGILRAPRLLADGLPSNTRNWLIEGLKKTRAIQPPETNWLLFSAVVESTLARLDSDWDPKPVEHALAMHKGWYVGDGIYGDGPTFHADYYDSFVIHPFMLGVLGSPAGHVGVGPELMQVEYDRATRYAAIQERSIGRDGTWPVVGRSIAYRCGAFHLLADMAWRRHLPEAVCPAQVRGALSAAIEASLGAPGTYDANGWLTIGLAGHQPALGEVYISTGSLYLCLEAFLPLGLGSEDAFWKDVDAPWTAKHVWGGGDLPADRALDGFHG